MINLFKKSISNEVALPDSKLNDETLFIEVYSAQDELLKEANRILTEPHQYSEERYVVLKKLSSLGFINAEQVKEFREMEDKKQEQGRVKKIVEYFMRNYPNNKFITENAVKTICEKYGLLLGEVSDYIAEIPEKNQNEIVNFKFKEFDFREPSEVYRSGLFASHLYRGLYDTSCDAENKDRWIEGKKLLIMAPENKFDMRNKEKIGHTIKLKDPIVLQPVSSGYLIVSSWGLEAKDPEIQNPRHN